MEARFPLTFGNNDVSDGYLNPRNPDIRILGRWQYLQATHRIEVSIHTIQIPGNKKECISHSVGLRLKSPSTGQRCKSL